MRQSRGVSLSLSASTPAHVTATPRLSLQLLDMSRQWWKVRDAGGEVGYVPNNVLEPDEEPLEQVGLKTGFIQTHTHTCEQ